MPEPAVRAHAAGEIQFGVSEDAMSWRLTTSGSPSTPGMSRSTTGAYGDFPEYYYERGNQFGGLLAWSRPMPTRDQRMEATLVAARTGLRSTS